MFGVFSRRIISRAAVAAQRNTRNMSHITTEMPKANGTVYMLAGLGLFIVSAGLVQGNGLITWGNAPDLSAAKKS